MADDEVKEELKTEDTAAEAENPATETPDEVKKDETGAEAADSKTAEAPAPKKKKSKKRAVPEGQVHILATFNNTIVTVTDNKGNVLTTGSAGASGFRGSKKGTGYAAQVAAEKALNEARQNYGLSKVDILVKGVGLGREAAIRTLVNQRIQVDSVRDITGIAHGGVRPRKAKRN